MQATDSPITLGAIGIPNGPAVFLEPGNMSSHSTGGGQQVLIGLAHGVDQYNAPRSMNSATAADIRSIVDAPTIDLGKLQPCTNQRALTEFQRHFQTGQARRVIAPRP